ncbi:MAG: SPFH domain-containing protein, partial [Novosphingobium sp.]
MEEFWNNHKLSIVAILALAIATMASVVVVPETQQAVVVRTGEPVRVINRFRPNTDFGRTGAGLVFRIPFFEQVQRVDKRVLSVEMQRQQVLSSDQQRLEVDAYARFRIIDPVRMVETAGTEEMVAEQLQPILMSVLRQELGRRSFASLLTADRGTAMKNIRENLDKEAREYGAQVIDV